MNSLFGTINWADFSKGLLIAFGTVFFGGLVEYFTNAQFPTWQQVGSLAIAGAGAALSYLLKNLFTNSANQLGKKEPDVIK